eukprot:TRINITY_DN2505_c0_g1_i3.p1 TRINITY_DN2505_c0_g1~~TRINITY_DN2505_c0_g1_i3.p1  ORF type:complete len:196 (+),score=16.33 TRINITY_DN2505_c0_g1_i3:108-695(+)
MATRNLLLLGGSGNLGREVVRAFAKRWRVASVDVRANNEAAKSITLSTSRPVSEQANEIRNQLTSFSPRFDAVISVAGGFTMENIKDQSLFANYERMSQVNVVSSLLGDLASPRPLTVSISCALSIGASGLQWPFGPYRSCRCLQGRTSSDDRVLIGQGERSHTCADTGEVFGAAKWNFCSHDSAVRYENFSSVM